MKGNEAIWSGAWLKFEVPAFVPRVTPDDAAWQDLEEGAMGPHNLSDNTSLVC